MSAHLSRCPTCNRRGSERLGEYQPEHGACVATPHCPDPFHDLAAAAAAYARLKRLRTLPLSASIAVEVLRELGSPGCKYLDVAPAAPSALESEQ